MQRWREVGEYLSKISDMRANTLLDLLHLPVVSGIPFAAGTAAILHFLVPHIPIFFVTTYQRGAFASFLSRLIRN